MTEITRIILSGGPEPMTADQGEAGGSKYCREIYESVDQFRDRAAAQAEAAGEQTIIFGASEDDEWRVLS